MDPCIVVIGISEIGMLIILRHPGIGLCSDQLQQITK